MVEIKVKDLCLVGYGEKIHIKYPYSSIKRTYCASAWDKDEFEKGFLALTEKADELCKNCLREYKFDKKGEENETMAN